MPTIWDDSHIDRLQTLSSRNHKVQQAVDGVRQSIEPLILPDAAKVLTAIAAELMAGVYKRNRRADVKKACTALQNAITLLEAVDPNLDG